MAIANPTLVLNAFDTTNATSYDTAAVTLTAGRRYFISLDSRGTATGISTVEHDPDGTPLSFTQVTDGTTAAALTYGSNAYFEVWQVDVGTTTANALIRITANAATNGMTWILWYITGEDDTGTIVQVVTNSGAGTQSSVTMAAFGATDNMAFLGTASQSTFADKPISPEESRVEIAETANTEQYHHADHYQNPHGGDTTLTAGWTGSDDWGAIGIEILSLVVADQPPQDGLPSADSLLRPLIPSEYAGWQLWNIPALVVEEPAIQSSLPDFAPLIIPRVYPGLQKYPSPSHALRPDGDTSQSGNWLRETLSATNLYQSVDEPDQPVDTDFVFHDEVVGAEFFEISLSDIIGAQVGAGDVVIHWRAKQRSGADTITVRAELRENGTIIAQQSQAVTIQDTTYFLTLSAAERASINDWNALVLRFVVESVT